MSESKVLEGLRNSSESKSVIMNAFLEFRVDFENMKVTPIVQKMWMKGPAKPKPKKKKVEFVDGGEVEL